VLCRDQQLEVNDGVRLKMIENLALASGSRGMAGGQALDLDAVGKELDLVELENIHIHKTGALILASVRMGTLASPEVDPRQVRRLDHYAKCIGLAFQVQDDILDVEGDTETLGKTQGKDLAQAKPTYPALLGLEAAREKAFQLRNEALDSLSELGAKADPLRWLAEYIVKRKK
jgi:farnesyl diphosphate synthase